MKFAGKVLIVLVVLYGVAMMALRPAADASEPVTLFPASGEAPPDPNRRGAQVIGPITPVLSPPVAEMEVVEPNEYLFNREINSLRHGTLVDENGNLFGTTTEKIDDPLVAASHNEAANTPGLDFSFQGIGATGVLPPDTVGDVGLNHYVQMVNSRFRVWDKTGTPVTGEITIGTLFASVPGNACANDNDGDPIVLYDQFADKWLLSEFDTTSPYNVCVAISQTGDPTGAYWLYNIPTPRFPDYFKIGVWPDGYYMGTNSGFQNQYDVFVMERPDMIQGLPATVQYFQNFSNLMMPADADGSALPPAGSPGYFYTLKDGGEPYFNNPPNDRIEIYEFDVDWTTPANSTFTLAQAITEPTFAPFNWTVCGFFTTNCLPQPGTGALIDSASWWPMFRLQYRNFGSHEAMVGNFTVDVNSVGNRAGIRWFEVRKSNGVPGGPWMLYQQGTHSPDANHRFMGSIAMDGQGNIALGYSITSGSIFPSIRYATRLTTDPLGTLQTEATLMAGTGSQTFDPGRWGDYSAINVDPTNDCTFWVTNEYIQTTGPAPWLTRIGVFTIPECLAPDFTFDASPASLNICQGSNAVYTITLGSINSFGNPVTLSASGNPGSATFATNPLAPPGNTTMTISGAAAGSYNFDAVGTAGALVHQDTVQLEVSSAAPGAPGLLTPADGSLNASLLPSLTWNAVAGAVSYDLEMATDAAFANMVESASGLTTTSYTPGTALSSDTVYYWRVRANNACGNAWSAAFAFHTGTTQTTMTCRNGLTVNIPDNNPAGVNDDMVNPGSGFISDLNVVITATHTWVGDLRFTVSHVDTGTTVAVIDRPGVPATTYGCSQNHVGTTLDDEASLPVENQCATSGGPNPPPYAISGSFTPNNALTAFDGQSYAGTWRLNASDWVAPDTGQLRGWCLQATTSSNNPDRDYSDLANNYGVAWHEGNGALRLGTLWSADSSFAMDSDDPSDDGVVRIGGTWTAGSPVGLNVTVSGGDGNDYLACWFDWNDDGVLDNPAEKTVAQAVNNGANMINFNVPAGFDPSTNSVLDSRCRLYEAEPLGMEATETPEGGVVDGEVEDYRWMFSPTAVTLRNTRLGAVSNTTWLVVSLVAVMLLSLGVVVSRRRLR